MQKSIASLQSMLMSYAHDVVALNLGDAGEAGANPFGTIVTPNETCHEYPWLNHKGNVWYGVWVPILSWQVHE